MDIIRYSQKNHVQRQYARLRGRVITVAGAPGAGKTRFCEDVVHYLNNDGVAAKHFKEYVNNDLLGLYLSNMKAYAFPFQTIMIQRRIGIYREALEYAATGGIAIIDGPVNTDNAFELMNYAKGFISKREHLVYLSMLKEYEELPEPDHVIYLDCSIQTLIKRVKERGRPGEAENYDELFYRTLFAAYSLAFSNLHVKSIPYNEDCILVDNRLSSSHVYKILDQIDDCMTPTLLEGNISDIAELRQIIMSK